MRVILLISILFVFVIQLVDLPEARAGNPAPLFDRPVKLDDSGKPLYNSWERQEYMRKLKEKNRKKKLKLMQEANGTQKTETKKSVLQEQTPSSAVINRPLSTAE